MPERKKQTCIACADDAPRAGRVAILGFQSQHPAWQIEVEDQIDKLRRRFSFESYEDAVDFTNELAEMSEFEKHHPAILLEWGAVTVTWWTHKIGGLHSNDLVMAQQTDELFESRSA